MKTTAERLANLFRGFETAHGTYGSPEKESKPTGTKWGIKNSARTKREPPTIELFQKHIDGTYPLGIIPITSKGTCWWGSIDVDDYSLNPLLLIQKIENNSLPLVPVVSKSGGLHLFIFLTEEQPAGLVQAVLQHLAAKLGLSNSEIFPKQTEVLTERGDLGNWLCIPGLGTTFGGKFSEQSGIKKTGSRQTLEEFLSHAENSKVSPEILAGFDSDHEPKRGKVVELKQPFSDGPPCLQHLATQGIQDGGRNNVLFMICLYMIRKYGVNGDWRAEVEKANRDYFNPPLDSGEVQSVIKSIEKKAPKPGDDDSGYKYTCKTQPMASHCNSKLCRGKKYGIGSDEEIPKLTGISKLDTEPPIWFVNIGDLRIEATTEQLQQYMRFHALCMEKGNVCFRMMKQADWMMLLGEALQSDITILEVPSDVGITGHFKELLEEYLLDRQVADEKEDLLRGLPWHDHEKGVIYFRLSSLQTFLDRQNFKSYNRSKIIQRIRDIGGNNGFLNIKGKGVNFWWLPDDIFTPAITYDLPALKKTPI